MAVLPAGWPAEAPVEVLPAVYVAFPDASWPPATARTPLGVAAVASWHLERELVGSVLPGNVRARSGLSVGSAGVSLAQVGADATRLAPWSKDHARRVTVGQPAELYAAHGGAGSPVRVDMGDWVVAPASGSIGGAEVSVDLLERQYVGRTLVQGLPVGRDEVDPAWIVDTLARQVGYYSTPPAAPTAIISAPLAGSGVPEVGVSGGALIDGWGRDTGALGTAGTAIAIFLWKDPGAVLAGASDGVYVTANVTGTLKLTFGVVGGPELEIHSTGQLRLRRDGTSAWAQTSFTPGQDTDQPNRVQVWLRHQDGNLVASARSSSAAAWSPSASVGGNVGSAFPQVRLDVAAGSSASGLQITRAADAALWIKPNAELHALGGRMPAPWLPGGTDPWAGIQQVCSAHLGACWVRSDKTLVLADRDWLAGATTDGEPFDVGRRVEDLGWTVDPADAADRLVVTYAPLDLVEVLEDGLQPIAWAAPDAIELGPYQTVEVTADVDFFARVAPEPRWIGAWDDANLPLGSTFCTFNARDGAASGGQLAAYNGVTISVRHVNGNRYVIRLTNNLNTTLWTVDATGQPCLILRAPAISPQANTASIVRGAGEADATNPLTIDLGKLVQRAEDAEAIADYIWARVSTQMWKASSVRTRLDWGVDIGDIIRLQHERSDLEVKALVTKVALDGQPGEVTQSLDLVLLPTTWGDFDAAWAAGTWADFDTRWAASTWSELDFDPLSTEE